MEQVQIQNKSIKLFGVDEIGSNLQAIKSNFWVKIMIIISILIVIYILIPKGNFINKIPTVGSLITNDIVSDRDVLVIDKKATKFKLNASLDKLGVFLDYDPLSYQRIIEKINSSFLKLEQKTQLINQQKIKLANKSKETSNKNISLIQSIEKTNYEQNLITKHYNFLKKNPKNIDNSNALMQTSQKIAFLINQKNKLEENKKIFAEEIADIQKEVNNLKKNIKLNKEKNIEILFQDLGFSFDQKLLLLLRNLPNYKLLTKKINDTIRIFDRYYIVADKEIIKNNDSKKIQIYNLETDTILEYPETVKFIDLKDANFLLTQNIEKNNPEYPFQINKIALIITQKLLIPTSFENKQKLENKRKEINNKSNSVFLNVQKGEVLAKKGDVVDKEKVDFIFNYFVSVNQGKGLIYTISLVILIILIFLLVFFALKLDKKSIDIFYDNFLILWVSLVVGLIVIYLIKETFELLAIRYQIFSFSNYIYALPLTLGVMLCGTLTNFRINLPNAFLTSLCATIYLDENLYFFIFCWISSSFTCLILTNINTRFDLLKKGITISLFNIPTIIILETLISNAIPDNILESIISVFIGGILATFLNIILLPLFEQIFGVSTQLKLLELANLNHPLLKQLQHRAPGTYQHAILVGSLAESGAQKIGTNPLLAKIGAYYHDIGKVVEPHYFNENFTNAQKSPHNKLLPQDSVKKIINHVIYGIQLAQKFKLGKKIINIISCHHGNGLIKFFYTEAQKKSKKTIPKENFSYPTNRPRDIETAIIMLADSCEVAVRNLKKCNEATITKTVNNIFQSIIDNQQLDNSGINLTQLRMLRNSFIDILISLNHNRSLEKNN